MPVIAGVIDTQTHSSNVMSTPMCAIDGEAVGRIRDILIDTDLLERAYA